jgi:hypothetical protein
LYTLHIALFGRLKTPCSSLSQNQESKINAS